MYKVWFGVNWRGAASVFIINLTRPAKAMTGCPSQVADLSIPQTNTLKSLVRNKLHELDSFADESLTEYVMVLLANRHGMAKVISDLEDFLSPMVVEDFVQWLFGKCKELKSSKEDSERRVLDKKSRIFENAWKVVSTSNTSERRGGERDYEMIDRRDSGMPEKNAHRDEALMTERRGNRDGAMMAERRGNRDETLMAERRGNSSSNSISRDARNLIRTSERARSPQSKSRSPESGSLCRQSSRTIKYESISSRLTKGTFCEDEDVIDARDLLSSRRDGRLGRDNRNRDCGYRNDGKRLRNYSHHEHEQEHETRSRRTVKLVQERSQKSSLEDNSLVRCTYWPNCKAGEDCPYAHPSEPCKHFPSCAFGEKCIYIHPVIPCKFQDRCQNPHCNYQHQSPAGLVGGSFMTSNNPYQPPSAIPCRFFPNCKNANCSFLHPNTAVCKFAETCQRPACPFVHPNGRVLASKSFVNAPCRYGKTCTKLDCPFQHLVSPTTADTTSVAEIAT